MVFSFTLERTDGAPAEPPTLSSAVPNWRPGDTTAPLTFARKRRTLVCRQALAQAFRLEGRRANE